MQTIEGVLIVHELNHGVCEYTFINDELFIGFCKGALLVDVELGYLAYSALKSTIAL